MRTVKLTKESTKDILENLLKRSPNNYGKFESTVAQILDKVKNEGDAALFAYTKEFDKADVTKETIRVTDAEIEEAYAQIDPALLGVIRKALVNIRQYHEKQIQNSWFTSTTDGTMLGQKVTPLNRVGVYVPGGKAVYPSSVLMNIVPAKVAGVPHIVMTTPPGKDGKVCASTLVAAKEAGADEIYKVGGAQAIGALAFGTESIPKVDKIVGPGNIFAVQSISGGGFHFLFQRAQTVLHINNVLFGGNQFFVNGMMAMNVLILGKIADLFVLCNNHITGICGNLLHDNAKESGLSGTVIADQGSFFPFFYVKRSILQNDLLSKGFEDALT